MSDFRKEWLHAALYFNDMNLAKAILNHVRSFDEFVANDDHISLLGEESERLKVLDFGCGLGRNTVAMASRKNWEVHAYDSEPMLERAKRFQEKKLETVKLTSDWKKLKRNNYDAVLASFVFQHMNCDELKSKIEDISNMTKKLVVFGRRATDDGNEVWPLVAEKFDIVWNDEHFNIMGRRNDHNLVIFKPRKDVSRTTKAATEEIEPSGFFASLR